MSEWMIGTALVAVTLSAAVSYLVAKRTVERRDPPTLEHAGRNLPEAFGDGARVAKTPDDDPRGK